MNTREQERFHNLQKQLTIAKRALENIKIIDPVRHYGIAEEALEQIEQLEMGKTHALNKKSDKIASHSGYDHREHDYYDEGDLS